MIKYGTMFTYKCSSCGEEVSLDNPIEELADYEKIACGDSCTHKFELIQSPKEENNEDSGSVGSN